MWETQPFIFSGRPRLLGGAGASRETGALLAERKVTRVLFVTDPGIAASGLAQPAIESVSERGLAVALFEQVEENPTDATVDACAEVARAFQADALVGIGGGSSLDTAKAANFLLSHGGRIHDYWGKNKAGGPMLPLIAIPTTTGTGSECQSFAIISDRATHQKMACGDDHAFPLVAILDPELVVSQPPAVRVATGIDALAHALESMVASCANPFSQSLSREAFRLTAGALGPAMRHREDLDSHRRLQLGAAFAGMAIECAMLGAAHAMANPLTARYGLVHGRAIALVLPAVVTFNATRPDVAAAYQELAVGAGLCPPTLPPAEALTALIAHIDHLRQLGGLPRTFAEAGADPADIPALASLAAAQWTNGFNPVPINEAGYRQLYARIA